MAGAEVLGTVLEIWESPVLSCLPWRQLRILTLFMPSWFHWLLSSYFVFCRSTARGESKGKQLQI